MPKYSVKIKHHVRSAQSKGMIGPLYFASTPGDGATLGHTDFVFEADDHAHAYQKLQVGFVYDDARPLAGKSYLGSCVVHAPRVGDRVALKRPYPIGFDAQGTRLHAQFGTVSEVVNESTGYIAVHPEGYREFFVDFGAGEYRVVERRTAKQRAEAAAKYKK